MNTTTNTTDLQTATFAVEYLGDGNWEVTAPNGVWTITADTADLTADEIAFHIEGPNHHHGEHWADSLEGVDEIVRQYGVDRRSAK
jgi:hypothetical protein